MRQKIAKATRLLRDEGFSGVIYHFRNRYWLRIYSLPLLNTTKNKWRKGIRSSVLFWDKYFRTKGSRWSNKYGLRFDPQLPLQPRPASLLPNREEVYILDVGAGPLTYLGKIVEGKKIHISAVDALSNEYDRILKNYEIEPLVRTEELDAERLTTRFSTNTFDLVFARNCIDHSYDPELAIEQMILVVKRGCYVLMEHHPDEAKTENYSGQHQWNFSMSELGDFLIRSRRSVVNITKKYSKLCDVTCELLSECGERWLITKLRKK